jgi:DNA-binding protein HU-beta
MSEYGPLGWPVNFARKVGKPAKKAAPAKATAQATIMLKHLGAALADSHEIAKKQAEAVLGDLVTLTPRHSKRGDKIRLTGLGILQLRKRAARMGISRPARPSRSRRARRSRFGLPGN